jgi:hypothetical protein
MYVVLRVVASVLFVAATAHGSSLKAPAKPRLPSAGDAIVNRILDFPFLGLGYLGEQVAHFFRGEMSV